MLPPPAPKLRPIQDTVSDSSCHLPESSFIESAGKSSYSISFPIRHHQQRRLMTDLHQTKRKMKASKQLTEMLTVLS